MIYGNTRFKTVSENPLKKILSDTFSLYIIILIFKNPETLMKKKAIIGHVLKASNVSYEKLYFIYSNTSNNFAFYVRMEEKTEQLQRTHELPLLRILNTQESITLFLFL